MRRLSKEEWAKLKRAFIFGHSLGAIAQATGVSRGTLSAHSARHNWSRDRGADTDNFEKGKRMVEMNDETQQHKTPGGATGRGFTKGDPRINRKGRPRSFDELRKIAKRISHEDVIDAAGNAVTTAELMLRRWSRSKNPMLQKLFVEIAFGPVPPTKIEAESLEPKTRLILHFPHELPDWQPPGNGAARRLKGP